MAEHIQHHRYVRYSGDSLHSPEVVDRSSARADIQQTHSQFTLVRVVWFVAGVLLALLAFRFVLALLGANPGNEFASFIYTLSYPFVAPFFTLFSYNLRYGVSRLEIYTLVAMAVYALLAYAIARLVTIDRPQNQVDEEV